MEFYSITWDEFHQRVFQISEKIASDKFSPDLIITIARGGLAAAQIFADYFDNCPIATFGICSYKNLKQYKTPEVTLPLSEKIDLKNKKILFVDDLSDTGETFLVGLDYLKTLGAKNIKTASLVVKSKTKYQPDYYSLNNNSWIIFPYEMKETTVSLVNKFKKEGMGKKTIVLNLKKLKILKRYIERYFDLLK